MSLGRDHGPMPNKGRAGPLARLLGHQIRATRVALDVPLAEVAARVHLTPSYVARLERGLVNPTLGAVESLIEALGTASPAGANSARTVAAASAVSRPCTVHSGRRLIRAARIAST